MLHLKSEGVTDIYNLTYMNENVCFNVHERAEGASRLPIQGIIIETENEKKVSSMTYAVC